MNTGRRWPIAMIAVLAALLAAGGAQMWPASGPTGPRDGVPRDNAATSAAVACTTAQIVG